MPTTPADGNAGDQSACMRFGCADNPIAISYVISHKLIMKLVLNTAAMVAAIRSDAGASRRLLRTALLGLCFA
jgi:hypothetical protein